MDVFGCFVQGPFHAFCGCIAWKDRFNPIPKFRPACLHEDQTRSMISIEQIERRRKQVVPGNKRTRCCLECGMSCCKRGDQWPFCTQFILKFKLAPQEITRSLSQL